LSPTIFLLIFLWVWSSLSPHNLWDSLSLHWLTGLVLKWGCRLLIVFRGFLYFYIVFFSYHIGVGEFDIWISMKYNFKKVACACNVFRWRVWCKTPFCHVVWSVAPSTSYCGGTWWLWCGDATSMTFPPSSFFSSPLEIHAGHVKFYYCLLIYWDFEFDPCFFKKNFCSWIFCKILLIFLDHFVKSIFFSISPFNKIFC